MMGRNLARRLKQLEVRLTPAVKHRRIVIQFINPKDRNVSGTLTIDNGRSEWNPPRNGPVANLAGDDRV